MALLTMPKGDEESRRCLSGADARDSQGGGDAVEEGSPTTWNATLFSPRWAVVAQGEINETGQRLLTLLPP